MKVFVVTHPDGDSVWLCSFPETGSEPQVLKHHQFIYDLGQERDKLRKDVTLLRDELLRVKGICLREVGLGIVNEVVLAATEPTSIQTDT